MLMAGRGNQLSPTQQDTLLQPGLGIITPDFPELLSKSNDRPPNPLHFCHTFPLVEVTPPKSSLTHHCRETACLCGNEEEEKGEKKEKKEELELPLILSTINPRS